MKTNFIKLPLVAAILFFTGQWAVQSCGNGTGSSDAAGIPDSTVKMVKAVCSRCHEFVPAEMLDKKTWRDLVLPAMAAKMGIFEYEGQRTTNENTDPNAPAGAYPTKPTIAYADLRKVFEYFEAMAPDQLPLQERKVPIGGITSRFNSKFPSLPPTDAPMTTFVAIRPQEKRIVLGVGGKMNRLGLFNEKLEPQWVMGMPSAPAFIDFVGPSNWLVTCMGHVMPSNKKEGMLLQFTPPSGNQSGTTKELLTKLGRPVQIMQMDMDGDGSNDLLVNGFGHLAGKFYWLKNGQANNENLLRGEPGAIRTMVLDWDDDGRKDLITMFTQNKEGIFLFRNKGNGQYEEIKLMEFLPVYGSSYFDIRDINGDGKKDIVYTSGDNADFSVTLKSFHGVYLYLNDGNNKFKQAYFYPIHGCYKAVMRDFDLDGDQDMITISFFADYITQHKEALVYFENQGNLDFKPHSVAGFDKGRWLTMDVGDLDGDGDEDVITGNFAFGPESFLSPGQPEKFAEQPVFMFLENTTK